MFFWKTSIFTISLQDLFSHSLLWFLKFSYVDMYSCSLIISKDTVCMWTVSVGNELEGGSLLMCSSALWALAPCAHHSIQPPPNNISLSHLQNVQAPLGCPNLLASPELCWEVLKHSRMLESHFWTGVMWRTLVWIMILCLWEEILSRLRKKLSSVG